MKQLLLLACLLALCAASPTSVAQTAKTYSWMLDMFVLSFDSVIIAVLTPIWRKIKETSGFTPPSTCMDLLG